MSLEDYTGLISGYERKVRRSKTEGDGVTDAEAGVLRSECRGGGHELRNTGSLWKPEKARKCIIPLKPPEGTLACQQPDFRLLISRIEENRFVVSSH